MAAEQRLSTRGKPAKRKQQEQATRHLDMVSLLEFIAPDEGWQLSRALCASYSAQASVLAAMLMAMVGQARPDGKGTDVALARAFHQLRGRVHFLIQHGRLTARRRSVLAILDRFVQNVPYDERGYGGCSWHPKVCLLKYENRGAHDDDAPKVQWKLWLGSRNFTSDNSWDICLALRSEEDAKRGQLIEGIGELAQGLASQANQSKFWKGDVQQLPKVRWAVPVGLRVPLVKLMLPDQTGRGLPGPGFMPNKLVAVAPFVDATTLKQLTHATPGCSRRLVSTTDSLVDAANASKAWFSDFECQSLDSPYVEVRNDEPAPERPNDAEPEPKGLHAKVLWAHDSKRGVLHLGSPNLTTRGWSRNAEVFARIEIDALKRNGAASDLVNGIERFLSLCTYVDEQVIGEGTTKDTIAETLEAHRKALTATLSLMQAIGDNGIVTVTSNSPVTVPAGMDFGVGRIGEVPTDWRPGAQSAQMPAAPLEENSELLQLRLHLEGREVSWLLSARFSPELSVHDRDLPLLRSYLGLQGLLGWLGEALSPGGASGEGRDWDEEPKHEHKRTKRELALPDHLSVEAVLSAWVRENRTLQEMSWVVEMAQQLVQTNTDLPEEMAQRLKAFLASWKTIEGTLR